MQTRIYIVPLFFFTMVFLCSNAQETNTILQGTIKHDSTYLQDINIINKTTNLGTFSNENGKFIIRASLGDSIIFSSVVYQNRIIKLTENHIRSKSIIIFLEPGLTELEVVNIQKKFIFNSEKIAVDERAVLKNDKLSSKKAPDATKFTDPNAKMVGVSLRSLLRLLTKTFRKKRKEKKLEKEKLLYIKNQFPEKIKTLYGDDFFIEWLKIPKDEIYLFLNYCEGLGLKELYNANEFQIKDFLVKHSIQFNLLKK